MGSRADIDLIDSFRRLFLRVTPLLVLVVVLTAPVGAGAQPVAPAATGGRYVALGDSFSSGEGVPPFEPGTDTLFNQCHRSGRAYPVLVANELPVRPVSARWACSGATTSSLLNGRGNEGPQIDNLDASTTLVTLTIGGNDVGFSTAMLSCLLQSSCHVRQGRRVADATARLARTLPGVYGAILRRAPNARVLVVTYPRLFPATPTRTCVPGIGAVDPAEQRWINAATLRLDRVIASAVSRLRNPRLRHVNAFGAFTGRELCTAGTAMNGVVLTRPVYSIHPNVLGQTLLKNLVVVAAKA